MRQTAVTAAVIALILLSGCCSFITDLDKTNTTNGLTEKNPPFVDLKLNKTIGPAPFSTPYTYWCRDPDYNLVACELRIDGQTYAKGTNQSTLLPKDFEYPDFYWEVMNQVGNHTLEIYATDSDGLTSIKTVEFTVLKGIALTKPGWYDCNSNYNSPPCDYMYEDYCNKIVPEDIAVRQAAADAISKHPGAFSINQLLDIYDWVHANVFYQNVPIDKWPPYPPNETLRTKSGDCKNQAVLIASMVEAIGGSARVLYIPECRHAFTEVYLGNSRDVNTLSDAVWAHYDIAEGTVPTWHYYTNEDNETENWFIFDTAGGWYPGNTIPDCMNASRVYLLMNCNRDPTELNAPEMEGTSYGPIIRLNETKILPAGWYQYYWVSPWLSTVPEYTWCHYKLQVKSLSTKPVDWYVTNEQGYREYVAQQGFSYYYGEEQVMGADYEFNWNKLDDIYLILTNSDPQSSITIRTTVTETCYKD